jgi:hypothetical protein
METCKHVGEVLQQSPSFSSSGNPHAFSDADLTQLRQQIKKIMIPKLIRVFELKLAAQQASMPPSRLLGNRPDETKLEEILAELGSLKDDVYLLQLWCDNCQKQVNKAIEEVSEAKMKMGSSA